MYDTDDAYEDVKAGDDVLGPAHSLLIFTLFHSVSGHRREVRRLLFCKLMKLARARPARRKEGLPLIKLARFGDKKTSRGSLRHDANVLAITGVEIDYDGGVMSLAEAAAILQAAGIVAMLYETPSSEPDAPRWRTLLPFSKEYPPEDRKRFVARVNGLLGGIVAPESFNLSQAFFIGGIEGKPVPKVVHVKGSRYLDEASELDDGALGQREDKAARPPARQDASLTRALDDDDLSAEYATRPLDVDDAVFSAAVRAIRNNDRFDDWNAFVKVAAAIKAQLGEKGKAVFLEWAASRQSGAVDRKIDLKVWQSLRPASKRGHVTGATILHYAKRDGWVREDADVEIPVGDMRSARRFVELNKGIFLYQYLDCSATVWMRSARRSG